MDFRRIPFQFSTADPLKRQEELQRRFGLPANKSNMYVDLANSGPMGARLDTSSASNSPRLQHRVPIFVEGQSEPASPSVGAQNVDSGRKPHVRVIPIEIEGEDSTNRKSWLSGSSEPMKERVGTTTIPVETVKHPVLDPSPKSPRICNIPIKIEGRDHVSQPKTQKAKTQESSKCLGVKLNGCSTSRAAKVNEIKEALKAAEKKESPEEKTLKKIQNIEEKLRGYHADVEKFSGTNKDKQYRYLDEMLTRCMLELDEIDTMGLETIRLARKATVKKVQASVDLLESKINKGEPAKEDQVLKEPMEVESSTDRPSENSEMTNVVFTEVGIDDQAEVERTADVEMTDILPEQINEKVENISIMETEDAVLKPDEEQVSSDPMNETSVTNEEIDAEVKSPVQITEVGADIAASETEPVVEEPVSDSKGENAIEMDLDSCGCESDSKLDKCSFQICEVENDTVSSPSKLEAEDNEPTNQNSEMDITDIPVTTEKSSENSQVTDRVRELTAADQSATSIKTNKDC